MPDNKHITINISFTCVNVRTEMKLHTIAHMKIDIRTWKSKEILWLFQFARACSICWSMKESKSGFCSLWTEETRLIVSFLCFYTWTAKEGFWHFYSLLRALLWLWVVVFLCVQESDLSALPSAKYKKVS